MCGKRVNLKSSAPADQGVGQGEARVRFKAFKVLEDDVLLGVWGSGSLWAA